MDAHNSLHKKNTLAQAQALGMPADIRVRGQEVGELRHAHGPVQEPVVEVQVNHLSTVLDLSSTHKKN